MSSNHKETARDIIDRDHKETARDIIDRALEDAPAYQDCETGYGKAIQYAVGPIIEKALELRRTATLAHTGHADSNCPKCRAIAAFDEVVK